MRSKLGRNPEKVRHVGCNGWHGLGLEERRRPSTTKSGSSERGGDEKYPGPTTDSKSETSLFFELRFSFRLKSSAIYVVLLPSGKELDK